MKAIKASRVPRSRDTRGFTLLELLVVMTLLSLLMTGLISALRTMAQTESKIDQRLLWLDETRVARAFLQQTLSRVSAAKLDAPGATGKSIVPFVATSDSLVWVGILPARPNVGGRHFFRLAMEEVASNPELVLRFAPCNADMAFPDWSQAESRILIKGVEQFDVQAQGLPQPGSARANAWPRGWQSGWPVPDALPEQLRLHIKGSRGDWPQWLFALRALPQGDDSLNDISLGGH